MRTARAKRGVRRASSTIRPSGAHPICSASVALTTAMRLGCCHRGVARTSAAREPHRRNLKRANARGVRRRDRSTPAGAPLRSQRKHHSMVTRRALRRRRPVVCVRPALLLGIPTAIVHSRILSNALPLVSTVNNPNGRALIVDFFGTCFPCYANCRYANGWTVLYLVLFFAASHPLPFFYYY